MAVYTYQDYLEKPKAMTVEEMQSLHEELLSEITGDEDGLELYEDFVKSAVKYADIRAGWKLLTREEKDAKNDTRTAVHDSLIVHVDVLARCAKMLGKNAQWRDVLGYEEDDQYNRKRIGDFACYISFIHGINAR